MVLRMEVFGCNLKRERQREQLVDGRDYVASACHCESAVLMLSAMLGRNVAVAATYRRAEVLLHVDYDERWPEVRHAVSVGENQQEYMRPAAGGWWPSNGTALRLAGVMQEMQKWSGSAAWERQRFGGPTGHVHQLG